MVVHIGADAGPQREARIRRYQARAEEGLPLFEDGDSHNEKRGLRQCVACDAVATMLRRGRMPDGWRVRRFTRTDEECHCPECFALWGWGDEIAARAAAGVGLFHPDDGKPTEDEG